MYVTELPRTIDVRLVQPPKELREMVDVTESPTTTCERRVHPLKTELARDVTELPMMIDVRLVQVLKALSPRDVTESEMKTDDSLVQKENT
jgi:hypothetical protein